MQKVKSISEESKELAQLMKSQPQVEQKVNYYKEIMFSKQELHESLQKRLQRGFTLSVSLVLGIIPIIKLRLLDGVSKARLKDEMLELENTVYCQQQYYEHWLQNSKDYANRMDGITRECNQNFDDILEKAQEVRNNVRLAQGIKNYKNDDNDQQLKNEYYLFLKQEVNNAEVHKGRR